MKRLVYVLIMLALLCAVIAPRPVQAGIGQSFTVIEKTRTRTVEKSEVVLGDIIIVDVLVCTPQEGVNCY